MASFPEFLKQVSTMEIRAEAPFSIEMKCILVIREVGIQSAHNRETCILDSTQTDTWDKNTHP